MYICIYKYISYIFVTLYIHIYEKHDIMFDSNMKKNIIDMKKNIVVPEDRE